MARHVRRTNVCVRAHSCEGNATQSYAFAHEGPIQIWRMLEDVEEGAEITHSCKVPTYSRCILIRCVADVDVATPYEQRTQRFRELYGFQCRCTRCQAGASGPKERFVNALKG
jgi:hypothetical protein